MNDPVTGGPIPASAGIGLRAPHVPAFIAGHPAVGWLEVHSENYFAAGGPGRAALAHIRGDYPISVHGVGLSLGSADGVDQAHLAALRHLVDWLQPCLISEHLCWGAIGGIHMNDLLPLPLTQESLGVVADHVSQTQDVLGRRILIENISAYLSFACDAMSEAEFLVALSRRTGCGILLDVNNLYVNQVNRSIDAATYIDSIPPTLVGEIHLAGHSVQPWTAAGVLIDTHSTRVCDAVWALYQRAIARFPSAPTLIEWDADIPALDVLIGEAAHADRVAFDARDAAGDARVRAA